MIVGEVYIWYTNNIPTVVLIKNEQKIKQKQFVVKIKRPHDTIFVARLLSDNFTLAATLGDFKTDV